MQRNKKTSSEYEVVSVLKSGNFGNVSICKYLGSDRSVLQIAVNNNCVVCKSIKGQQQIEGAETYLDIDYKALAEKNEIEIISVLDKNKVGRRYPSSMVVKVNQNDTIISEIIAYKTGDETNPQKLISSDLEDFAKTICKNKLYRLMGADALRYLLDRFIASMWISQDQLHEQGILHLDSAPRNFLIKNDLSCVICDFGISLKMSNLKSGAAHTIRPMTFRLPSYLYGAVNTTNVTQDEGVERYLQYKTKEFIEGQILLPNTFYLSLSEKKDGMMLRFKSYHSDDTMTCHLPWTDTVFRAIKPEVFLPHLVDSTFKSILGTGNKLVPSLVYRCFGQYTQEFSVHEDLFGLRIGIMELVSILIDKHSIISETYHNVIFGKQLTLEEKLSAHYRAILTEANKLNDLILKTTITIFLSDFKLYLTQLPHQNETLENIRIRDRELIQEALHVFFSKNATHTESFAHLMGIFGCVVEQDTTEKNVDESIHLGQDYPFDLDEGEEESNEQEALSRSGGINQLTEEISNLLFEEEKLIKKIVKFVQLDLAIQDRMKHFRQDVALVKTTSVHNTHQLIREVDSIKNDVHEIEQQVSQKGFFAGKEKVQHSIQRFQSVLEKLDYKLHRN